MQELDVELNVLGYVEDGEYVALALEMDLRGYGATPDDAIADLDDQINMQFSFALTKTGSLDSAFLPAEEKYFQLYIRTKAAVLRDKIKVLQGEIAELRQDVFTAEISVHAANVIEAMKGDFSANYA